MASALILAALLYPTVVKTGENLFSDARWKSRTDSDKADIHAWSEGKGGPFSADEPNWRAESFVPESCFWRQDRKLEAGHRYLVGMWFKSDNARALVWCWSRTKSGKPFNERIYLYGGFNSCLAPYIRPEMKAKLAGGADRWKLIYRPLEVTEPLAIPVQFKFGIYMTTGAVTIAHPFLVDITDAKDLSLTAETTDGRPVKSLALLHVGVRDTIWSKPLPTPAVNLRETLVDGVDMLRGFDENKVDGHQLVVTYAVGTVEIVFAPQENAFQRR